MMAAAAGLADPTPPLKITTAQAPAPEGPPPPVDATAGADPAFDAWLASFRSRALSSGLPQGVIDRELAGLTPNPKVVALDGRQPEFSKPIGDYIRGAVSDDRIAIGRRKRDSLTWLPDVAKRYGAPGDILLGIWAMESAFGVVQGDFDTVRSLATLAYDGRRRDWAERQLIAALRILATGEATRAQLKGSWAGAMGQTQFLPETYLTTAVDADGDGRRDIWGSAQDALGSAANLLAKAGWRRGEGWAREVVLPSGFDYGLAEGPYQTPSAWASLGVKAADGYGWSLADSQAQAQLALPAGAAGPAFLLFPNHFVIRKYNNSVAYALAVGLLADRFTGGGPLVQPWPYETPLSLADRIAAQQALAKLGFDPGSADGVVGVNTRAALRNWQKARRLPADGYLSSGVIQQLKAEAGIGPAPSAPPQPAPAPTTASPPAGPGQLPGR